MPQPFKYCPQCGTELEEQDRDGIARMVCSAGACDYVNWDNPTPVVAAIVEHEGDIILAHNKLWPAQFFGLITGFLEKGELPEQGVIREVEEELGIQSEVVEFVGHYDFVQMNQLLIAYHVRAEGEIVLGDELDALRRVPPSKLKPWPMGTGHAVRDWLQRQGINPD
ncbi:MAG: NUDIX domain-containing protein [Salinisphaeraceae bacterium]|nr:NUDIX domain-containing protein [Salinisphaeraceae bacterium]